jgi:hypothetical protein
MGFSPFGGGIDFMFTLVPIIVVLGFILVIGLIIVRAIKGGMEWNNNNNSPVLTVSATVVTKRTAVSTHHHHHGNDTAMHHTSSSTTYFTTFEVESGSPGRLGEQFGASRTTSRIELKVPDKEYGMLVAGDVGKLTFQGTRYKNFERNRE